MLKFCGGLVLKERDSVREESRSLRFRRTTRSGRKILINFCGNRISGNDTAKSRNETLNLERSENPEQISFLLTHLSHLNDMMDDMIKI